MIKTLAITGPTASGKTALSIAVAKSIGAEIISCDSMQIYRGMDIGTAKATAEERAAVTHHLIDILCPSEDFSAEAYKRLAIPVAREISERGKIPMFVGGTGLYIDTVMRSSAEGAPESSREYREEQMARIKTEEDIDALWERLAALDPESAAAIHKNNVRRVIRALEIYDRTGKPKSYFDRLSKEKNSEISVSMITLDFHDRENLYSRVDKRVDEMIKEGLVAEVSALYEAGLLRDEYTAAQAIGYKEIISALRGENSLDDAVELIKLSTRRYAKRQLTWFRHEEDAYRIYIDTESGKMRKFEDILSEANDVVKRIYQ